MSDIIRISELTPASAPPYAASTLFEISVDAGAGSWLTRRASMADITATVGNNLTLTGRTLFPFGEISAIGQLGINATPPAAGGAYGTIGLPQYMPDALESMIRIGGIYNTSTDPAIFNVQCIWRSSDARWTSHNIFAFIPNIEPQIVGSMSQVGMMQAGSIWNSATDIPNLTGVTSQWAIGTGYTGTITNYTAYQANGLGNPQSITLPTVTSVRLYLASALSTNNGLTTGTTNQYAFYSAGITTGSAGGTVTNYGLRLILPSGGASAGSTTNYGIFLGGAVGVASGTGTVYNYAIYNGSTADVYLSAGRVGIKNNTPLVDLAVGTTAGTARSYNTFTSAGVNSEYAFLGDWSRIANTAVYGTFQTGTGVARDVMIQRGGVDFIGLYSANTLFTNTRLDLGGSTAINTTWSTYLTVTVPFNSSNNVAQYIIRLIPQVTPTAALTTLIGIEDATNYKGSLNLTNYYSYNSAPSAFTYTGTQLTNVAGYVASQATNVAAGGIAAYSSFWSRTTGYTGTTGLFSNYGLRVEPITASASGTGVVTNFGVNITVPSGGATAGSFAQNYGIYIQGAGGTAAGGTVQNWALHSSSTAPSLISGNLMWGTTSAFPMLERSGAELQVRLADDSGYASLSTATQAPGNNTNLAATTAFVSAAITAAPNKTITLTGDVTGTGTASFATTLATVATPGTVQGITFNAKGLVTAGVDMAYALLASPSFSGTPLAPTAAPGTSTTQIATTAFVATSFAPLNAPVFTGDARAVTPATSDNDTSIATTAYVKAQPFLLANQTITISGDVDGSGTTAITLTLDTVNANVGTFQGLTVNAKGLVTGATNMAYATLASPSFSGVPLAPTASAGTNTTQLATTAFVASAVATGGGAYVPLAGGVTMTGVLTIAPAAGNSFLALSSVGATQSFVSYQTAGSNRWLLGSNSTAESGSNVGSDFGLQRFSDTGVFQDYAVFVERATGRVGIGLGVGQLPQADMHIGPTATTRAYQAYTDSLNGTWAYMGDWVKTANNATYGTDFNGSGVARGVDIVAGGALAIRITATGEIGFGGLTNPSHHFQIAGESTSTTVMYCHATHTSANTGSHWGFYLTPTATPTGLTLGTYWALQSNAALQGATTVTNFIGVGSRINLDASFTGLVTDGYGFYAANPVITAPAKPFTNYTAYYAIGIANGAGLLSGAVINRGFHVASISAGSAGGTVTNEAVRIQVPIGGPTSGITTNYGLYITGAGGVATGGSVSNWALFNSSPLDNYIEGRIGIRFTAPQADLHIGGNTATARIYNLSGLVNAEWAYLGDWSHTANVATYGTNKLGTGLVRNLQFVIGGVVKADYGISTAGRWTFADPVTIPSMTLTTALPIASGGTAATTAVAALTSLGAAPTVSPVFTGNPTGPTPLTADSSVSLATTAYVKAQGYQTGNQTITVTGDVDGSGTTAIVLTLDTVNANVGTFQGITVDGKGRVTAAVNQGYAALASPVFTGNPTAPTPSIGDSDTSIATTAFVATSFATIASLSAYAPLASPGFSGIPTAPTPAPGINSGQLATTAFVVLSFAPLASPALSGTPTAPTAGVAVNTTQIATTAYVKSQAYLTGNQSITLTGPVTGTGTTTIATTLATVGIATGGTGAITAPLALTNLGAAALAGATFTGKVLTLASAAGTAGFNLPHGAAPTSPVSGDLWTTAAGGLFARIGSTTQNFLTLSTVPQTGSLALMGGQVRNYNLYTDVGNNDWAYMGEMIGGVATYGTGEIGSGVALPFQFMAGGILKFDFNLTTVGQWSFVDNVNIQITGGSASLTGVAGNLRLKNSTVTDGNFSRIEALSALGNSVAVIGFKTLDHTNSVAAFELGVRASGEASPLAKLDYNSTFTGKWRFSGDVVLAGGSGTLYFGSPLVATNPTIQVNAASLEIRQADNLAFAPLSCLTPATGNNSTLVATTAFVKAQNYLTASGVSGMTAGQIPIAATATTITSSGNLSGAVTTTNSLVTTLAANAVATTHITNSNVTYAKIQNVAANRLLGNSTGSAAVVAEIPLPLSIALGGTGSATGIYLPLAGGSTTGAVGIKHSAPQADLTIGTTTGTARTYNAYASPTDSTWAYLGDWAKQANVATYGTDFATGSSGLARSVSFVAGGIEALRITGTNQLFGFNMPGVAPTYMYDFAGSTTSIRAFNIITSITSSSTGSLRGLYHAPTITTTSATTTANIFGIDQDLTIDGTTPTVTVSSGLSSGIILKDTFTGTIGQGRGLFLGLTNNTGRPGAMPLFYGIHIGGISNGQGLTTGTVTNRIFNGANEITAGTGVGTGTITNQVVYVAVPSGAPAGGTTNNYGIHITGNGGVAAGGTVTNYAIWNESTANVYLSAGRVGIKTSAPQTDLHVGATLATARTYNSFADVGNASWAYLGDWGGSANIARYGTDNIGSGALSDVSLLRGGVEYLRLATGITANVGMNFGSTVAPGGANDLSRHIALYGTGYGFSVTGGRLNYLANSHRILSNTGVDWASITAAGLALYGATSGTVTLAVPAVAGANTITFPAGTTNFSATGGTGRVVKQLTAGGAFTVATVAASDMDNTPVSPVLVGTATMVGATAPRSIAVMGNYAYTGSNAATGQLEVWDITTATPVRISSLTLAASVLGSMSIAGQILYIPINNGSAALSIVDISNPKVPVLLSGQIAVIISSTLLSGGYLYLGTGGGGIRSYDVSDPAAPILKQSIAALSGGANSVGMAVRGKYLYVANSQAVAATGGFNIVDISDPANMVTVATYNTPANVRGVAVAGRYAYLTLSTATNNLEVVDIQDPTAPVRVALFDVTVAGASYVNPMIAGNYLYYIGTGGGNCLRVVNISNPAVPVNVTSATVGTPGGAQLVGNRMYITSGTGTLSVFNMVGLDAPTAKIGSVSADVLHVEGVSSFNGDMYAQRGLVVGNAGIFSRGPIMSDASDGAIPISASFGTGLVCIGGNSALNPALKRAGVNLQVRLGDDSALTPIEASNFFATQTSANANIAEFNYAHATTYAQNGFNAGARIAIYNTDYAAETSQCSRVQFGSFNSVGSPTIIGAVGVVITNHSSVAETGHMVFQLRDNAASAERGRIVANNWGVGGNFSTNLPQANLHVGHTAATARSYNINTDAANAEWAYLGDWGHTLNTATYGTNKIGLAARSMQFVTGGLLAATINATQQFLIGPSAVPINIASNAQGLQVYGTSGDARAHFVRYSANTSEFILAFGKSRGTPTAPGIVVSGDDLGTIHWYGDDGSLAGSLTEACASILVTTTGTVSAGIIPCFMDFFTSGAAGARTRRVRFTPEGGVNIGSTGDPGLGNLLVNGGNLYFAGLTSANVMLKRVATEVQARLGDDTAYGPMAGAVLAQAANEQGARIEFRSLTQLVTIAAAATTNTTIQIPINAVVLAVSTRVTTVIPTAASFSVGVTGTPGRYGAGILVAAGTTSPGTLAGPLFYAAATAIVITPNLTPATATGVVRVNIHYYLVQPPTS